MDISKSPGKRVVIVGAGIVGLAMARAMSLRGFQVTVFDRNARANGASIRNFGMVWPIGQPCGQLLSRALRSRQVWMELVAALGLYAVPAGSLHLAYHALEAAVLEEFYYLERQERRLSLLNPEQTLSLSSSVNPHGLRAALYSRDECIVDPREAIRRIPAYLAQQWNVAFEWEEAVVEADRGKVRCSSGMEKEADLIFICSGEDFSTLYPGLFRQQAITKCKLQMMRLQAQPPDWTLGPALCGGLSLIHYRSFQSAGSLLPLAEYFGKHFPGYLENGIHVMVSEHPGRILTVGDSHHYGSEHEPFESAAINQMVLSYLRQFTRFPVTEVGETWHGIYARMTNGQTECLLEAAPGVYIVNGLGGAGMTLSFGLAEEIAAAY